MQLETKSMLDQVWTGAYSADVVYLYECARLSGHLHHIPELESLGLLKPIQASNTAWCPECQSYGSEVQLHTPLNRPPCYYMQCENCGSVELEPETLRRWEFHFMPIVHLVADSLSCRGEICELVPDMLWNIGRAAIAGQSRPIYVGRCLIGDNADPVRPHLPAGKSPLLFTLSALPPEGLPGIDPDRFFELRSLVSFNDNRLRMDTHSVHDQVAELVRNNEPYKKPAKKRQSRAETIDALKHELHQHILSMKSMICQADDRGRSLKLPKLTHADLAKRIGKERSVTTRAIQDKSDPMLSILWQTASDEDAIRRYSRSI